MKYVMHKDKIEILDRSEFDAKHILECGQIFSYKQISGGYEVYSKDKKAAILERECGYDILTLDAKYFEKFFDLQTDYKEVKRKLSKFEILQKPIKFGQGIRILKQDLFETFISFIVSQNNNIKRIQLILNRMKEQIGTDMGGYYAFPTLEKMQSMPLSFYSEIGAGYRAKYLYEVVRQIDENTLEKMRDLEAKTLREKLISFSGIGPKVADCILLFGYGKKDVFPVDTWIAKMYKKYYHAEENREKIRNNLTEEFKELSGYAQQYLFYYQRSGDENGI